MPRVVPSQVCAFSDTICDPVAAPGPALFKPDAAQLSALLELADQIPPELLTMESDAYASFISSKALIRHVLAKWAAESASGYTPAVLSAMRPHNPVLGIRDALAQCPDESPTPGTSELDFITDLDLKAVLRSDIGAIERALSNGEWKAATVLAGSAIETLLLWALGQRPTADITNATAALLASGKLSRQPDSNLERWDLHEYNEFAFNLRLLENDTYIKINLAREYRNLIHPGRAQRLGQICDRGTTLSCVAALEHVVRDLSQP